MVDLIVSDAAQADLVDIQVYGILTFGLQASDAYLAGLQLAMDRLTVFPRMAAERLDLRKPVRILPHRSHIVVYEIEIDVVRILRVRHGSQDWYDNPTGETS